jgi:pimeloyl-ACP methyl ester carboxylesterase
LHGSCKVCQVMLKLALALVLAGSLVAVIFPLMSLAVRADSPSQLVDIGGRRLALTCAGSGRLTVLLENGLPLGLENGLPLGAPSDARETWAAIMPAVAQFTRVCTYDRANLGQSDPAPRPRTSQASVDDLQALLMRAGLPAPYVLVGWSYGGILARHYAILHPSDVAGIVLVDSAHEQQIARFVGALPPDAPPEIKQELAEEAAFRDNPEGVDVPQSFRQVASAGPLPPVPLVVLRRGQRAFPAGDAEFPDLEPVWQELQADLARRSPRGVLEIAEHSGHAIQHDEPERVVEAIRQVIAQGRVPVQAPAQVPR